MGSGTKTQNAAANNRNEETPISLKCTRYTKMELGLFDAGAATLDGLIGLEYGKLGVLCACKISTEAFRKHVVQKYSTWRRHRAPERPAGQSHSCRQKLAGLPDYPSPRTTRMLHDSRTTDLVCAQIRRCIIDGVSGHHALEINGSRL